MRFPVDLSLLHGVHHMPSIPVIERSMRRPELRLHDFCIPVNSYFPTADLLQSVRNRLNDILRYYPSDNHTISEMLGEYLEIDAANIVVANGSTELITWINQQFIKRDLATDVPTFGRWTDNPREIGHKVHAFHRRPERKFELNIDEFMRFAHDRNARAIATCNPNNPTSAFLPCEEMAKLLDQTSHMDVVVIDESFIDFVTEDAVPSVARDVIERDNMIVIKSLGKCLGLHGLRCGYAVCCRKLADKLRRSLPPWNVNSLAEELLRLTVSHGDQYESGRRQVVRDSQDFEASLRTVMGLTVYPTRSNFVFCRLDADINGREFRDRLLQQFGCFVRECGSKIGSSQQYLRIATRPPARARPPAGGNETDH